MVIGLGVALVVIGGLTTYLVANGQSNTVTVLETKSSVARGDTITAEDLKPIQITTGQGTAAFTPDQAAQAVGKVALVNLPSGTFVTAKNVGNSLPVANGSSVVGVALTAQQMPSYQVTPGDKVRIVVTPVAQGEPPENTPQSYKATVFATKWNSKTNQWIVDLVVPNAQATIIAATSATGRVALVVDSDAADTSGD